MRWKKINQTYSEIFATAVLAAVFCVLLSLHGFNAQLAEQVAAIESRSPILLSREVILEQPNGNNIGIPVAWTQNAIKQLAVQGADYGVVSQMSTESAILRTASSTHQRVVILNVGKEILSIIAPNRLCVSNVLFSIDNSGLSVANSKAWLVNQPILLADIPKSSLIDVLVPNVSGLLLIRCIRSNVSSPSLIFLPKAGGDKKAFDFLQNSLRGNLDVGEPSFGKPNILIEPLSQKVAMQLAKRYEWLRIMLVGLAFVTSAIALSIVMFDAIKVRGDYSVMRALGAPKRVLFLNSLSRTLARLLPAFIIGAIALLVFYLFADEKLMVIKASYLWQAALFVLAMTIVCMALHYIYAVIGVDARVVNSMSIAGGKFKGVSIGVSIALLALVAAQFSLFALSMNRYAIKLSYLPLGYNPSGLYVSELTLKDMTKLDEASTPVAALLAVVMQMAIQGKSVAIACNAPWDMDVLNMNSRYDSVGSVIDAGNGIAKVLQVPVNGRDLVPADAIIGNAMLLQAIDDEYAKASKMLGKTVGTFQGLMVGALVPMQRNMLIRVIRNDQCKFPYLLQRADTNNAGDAIENIRSIQQRIIMQVNDYTFSEPKPVVSIIDAYREPFQRTRWLGNLCLLAVFISALLLVYNTCASYVALHTRTIAIRYALGQSRAASALHVSVSIAKYATAGVVLAVLSWPYFESAIVKWFEYIPVLSWIEVILMCGSVSFFIGMLTYLIASLNIEGADLVTALRIE